MITLARSIASSASKLGVMPISTNFGQRSLSTASLAPWAQDTMTFERSVNNGVRLWKVTSSMPKSSLKVERIPTSGSPMVPVPTM